MLGYCSVVVLHVNVILEFVNRISLKKVDKALY